MKALSIPKLWLDDGSAMPQFGLGVWQVSDEEAVSSIHVALEAGYRLIDTAAMYENEEGVGQAIRTGPVAREELFITTKLWNDQQGTVETPKALQQSLQKLRLEYVDLYLIHWPAPAQDRYVEAWKALIKLKEEGLAKSIGVSNFHPAHLERVIQETGNVPAVNQVELHPLLAQRSLREFHAQHGIVTQSWSPLGRGKLKGNAILEQIAQKHDKSPTQVVIRWHLDNGLAVIPKSVTPARIRENISVFDFQLDADDLAQIATLDSGRRLGPEPYDFS